MSGLAVVAALLLGFLVVLAVLWRRPPEMSEGGIRRFRLGVVLAAISALLLSVDFGIVLSVSDSNFNFWRGRVFWVAFFGFWVNAAALFSFFRVLVNLLPFTKNDAADITPAGIMLGSQALLMQLAFAYFGVLCMFVP
jgi:hypothetical protein